MKYNTEQQESLDGKSLQSATMVLRAVNHKLRQRIIDLLEENVKMNIEEIYLKLRLEQSIAFQHLAILKRAGVVKSSKEGNQIFYRLDYDKLAKISKIVGELGR